MKIGLADVDSHNFPCLPLMKLSAYHKRRGDYVEMLNPFEHYDVVYMSKIFDFTPDYSTAIHADVIYKGGTGYKPADTSDERIRQGYSDSEYYISSLPPEIENIMPDYDLYPQYSEAYGFLTRGCPRNCPYCIVTKKEGNVSKQVAETGDFWTKQKTIKLLDPNLLACNDREKLLLQLIDTGASVDFTQGLDIRLVDSHVLQLLNRLKIKMIHFAWDNPREDLTAAFEFFNKHFRLKDYSRKGVYVLTNFNSTHDEDLHRVYALRDMGFNPYVMIYDKQNAPRETRLLQRYVNNRLIFRSVNSFEEYDCRRRRGATVRAFFQSEANENFQKGAST
ncbi:MAG: radical SAM protein [Defluviitaleaceae bacterium]|nr:radical SAM protein [Defluviitaleaceae bacterium]